MTFRQRMLSHGKFKSQNEDCNKLTSLLTRQFLFSLSIISIDGSLNENNRILMYMKLTPLIIAIKRVAISE